MKRISWTTIPMFCPRCGGKVYGNECGYKPHQHGEDYYMPVTAKFLAQLQEHEARQRESMKVIPQKPEAKQ